jgi:hypothetical protein
VTLINGKFGVKVKDVVHDDRFTSNPFRPVNLCCIVTHDVLMLGGNNTLYEKNDDGSSWSVRGTLS